MLCCYVVCGVVVVLYCCIIYYCVELCCIVALYIYYCVVVHPVNSTDINIDLLDLQAIQPRLYRVTIEYSFNYSYPSDGEFPVNFDVTVSYDESIVSRMLVLLSIVSIIIRVLLVCNDSIFELCHL